MTHPGARAMLRPPGRPSARAVAQAVALLAGLALAGGCLGLGVGWSMELAGWVGPAAAFTAIGLAVALRVPENPFGWLMLAIGAASAITAGTWAADVPGALAWARSWVMYLPVGLLPIALLLFPTGRLPSERWKPALVLAIAGAVVPTFFLAVASAVDPDPIGFLDPEAGRSVQRLVDVATLGAAAALLASAVGVLSLFARLPSASEVERRQVQCLFLGAVAILGGLALENAGLTGSLLAGWLVLALAPAVAIVWHRLYDLDLFMNRALVYATLNAALLVAFVAVVVALGRLLDRASLPPEATLVAIAGLALAFDPLRRRARRAVDRTLFGHRNDPYEAVTSLRREIRAATDAPSLLADVAEAVARSLALPWVAIEVDAVDGVARAAEWGRRYGEPASVALVYRGERIGRLLVTPRRVGAGLAERDRRLLEDIAQSVAVTVTAVELSAGLQRAREQLVTAREEERRRLRRDLHDGLGPTLAGMVMQLDVASNVLSRDPGAVEPVLAALRTAAQEAIAEIRRLVYELRPAALDELGLVGTIREWVDRLSGGDAEGRLALALHAPAALPALPAAVEVAALRIVQEAVANVVRHAGARTCRVRVVADEALTVDVEDDGRGLDENLKPGVGLSSMRERAAEVGGMCSVTRTAAGGTLVHAVLPLGSA